MKTLDRYLISQFFNTLVFATFLITAVFLGSDKYQDILYFICAYGADWLKTFVIAIFDLPSMIVHALPAGMVFACIFIVGNLSLSGELLALQMGGVRVRRILAPFLLLGMVASIFSFVLYEYVVPQAKLSGMKLIEVAIKTANLPTDRSSIVYFKEDKAKEDFENEVSRLPLPGSDEKKTRKILLVSYYKGNDLRNVVIFDQTGNHIHRISWAEVGRWAQGKWCLGKGHSYELADDIQTLVSSSFQNMEIDGINRKFFDPKDVGMFPYNNTRSELLAKIKELEGAGKVVPANILTQYYGRYTKPLACLVLMLASIPAFFNSHGRGRNTCFAYGGLVTVIYFLSSEYLPSMGAAGRLPPLLAATAPIICTLGFALVVYLVQRFLDMKR